MKNLKEKKQEHNDLKMLESKQRRIDFEQNLALFNDTLHEVRKLNNQIKAGIDRLNSLMKQMNLESCNEADLKDFHNIRKTLNANASLLSIRMNSYDVFLNPESLYADMSVELGVYSKIEKVYKSLYAFRKEKGVDVQLRGESNQKFLLNSMIELAFFVIIENAIKYSMPTSIINIEFLPNEKEKKLIVKFVNWGIKPKQDEIPHLVNRGNRSERAIRAGIKGNGLGLFILSQICQVNKVKLEIDVKKETKSYDGLIYAPFCVSLLFQS